ncbi:hypothetical protein VCRA2128O310_260057 [Vibrio crassostreae]|nr:hypothetical protein VCRA2116O233_280057 [Vibrio crassostreae]CAK2588618.1 hypothetical protein VCRA2110O3_170032 [Vibrio crassostreae]CAK2744032.1 hypothetical protein VCRA2119O244_250008 [Vibrio crassostreae]CAK2870883.1 hypothetical protein VCRA2133O313_250057 [Vibrio crassostreae]CAK2899159.1 hypothetical protein VCRA2127O303_290008 [Vibrio crassostreae]
MYRWLENLIITLDCHHHLTSPHAAQKTTNSDTVHTSKTSEALFSTQHRVYDESIPFVG